MTVEREVAFVEGGEEQGRRARGVESIFCNSDLNIVLFSIFFDTHYINYF